MKIVGLFLACVFASNLGSAATFPQDYTRVLLPIVIQFPDSGADGSVWVTHAVVANVSSTPVSILGYESFECHVDGCIDPDTPPNITFFPDFPISDPVGGYFLWVERGREADVHIGLRVQDLSREAETWGTELPVVPESAFLTTRAELAGIPISTGFRSNLRVYGLDPSTAHSARIKLYSVDPALRVPDFQDPSANNDQLLVDRTIALSDLNQLGDAGFGRPGMLYLDLSSLPELSGVQAIRAEITPADGDSFSFWALASTTNNATQQITTVSPR